MANRNPFDEATQVLGNGSGGVTQSTGLTTQLTTITQQLQQLQAINQSQIDAMQENTQAISQSTGAKAQSGTSTAETVGSTLQSALGFGLGLSPLISGLVDLFGGGGGQSPPAPLVPYVAPLPVEAAAGIRGSRAGAFAVDTVDGGLPRPAPASAAPARITVQVQAMDSQSFLDHSEDIAMAVRQAMLQSTALNDVIRAV